MKFIRNQVVQHWTLFSTLILLIGLVWIWFTRLPAGGIPAAAAAPARGFAAPDFVLSDASGQQVRLSDLRGRSVLLNFWASWCPPCQDEMPAMQRVSEQYSVQDFMILAVNTTFQDDEQSARKFVQDLGLTFPVLFDTEGAVSNTYQVSAMPTSFFIDRFGIIQEVVIGGPMAEALLISRVQQLSESSIMPDP